MATMKNWLVLWLALGSLVRADDLTALCADRTAIERVYYNHRLGAKPSFEQVSPPPLIERLVSEDLHKEAMLKKVYGVEVAPAMVAAEVDRINATTRAPDLLAELKAALGNDPDRFAQAVARPIVVERLLRDKFENDDALHAARRQQVETIRAELRAARSDTLLLRFKQLGSNQITETTWQLTPRPAKVGAPGADLVEIRKRFGPDTQILSSPQEAGREPKFYFADLPPELQRVLRVQLRQPGDLSAVIETPGGFLLYLCLTRNNTELGVAMLSLPKRSYEQWLAQPSE
jgi:hypothetical protein